MIAFNESLSNELYILLLLSFVLTALGYLGLWSGIKGYFDDKPTIRFFANTSTVLAFFGLVCFVMTSLYLLGFGDSGVETVFSILIAGVVSSVAYLLFISRVNVSEV